MESYTAFLFYKEKFKNQGSNFNNLRKSYKELKYLFKIR